MRRSFVLLSLVTLFASVGCGRVQLSLDDLAEVKPDPLKLSKGAEFVAAAQTGEKTINGYEVDSSVGSVFSQLEAKTPNGYKVYSTVQGHIVSDGKKQ